MSSESPGSSASAVAAVRQNSLSRAARRIRQIAATTTALTFILQNLAWAVCSEGSTFPDGGFTSLTAATWSPFVFPGALGSVWVSDISINEHNDPSEPRHPYVYEYVIAQLSVHRSQVWPLTPNTTSLRHYLPCLGAR